MTFTEKFQTIAEDAKLIGASCAIIKKHNWEYEMIEQVNWGRQSLENDVLVTSKTIFRIASVSKIVVAMAMMALIEEGKATIDSDISDILGFKIRNPHHPEVPLTIKMLMTQSSSITDGFNDDNPLPENENRTYNGVNGKNVFVALKDLLVPNDGPYYADATWNEEVPGTKFIYSNFGCGILACCVETLAKRPFTEFVKQRILDQLGVDASFQASTILHPERLADLYVEDQKEPSGFRKGKVASELLNNGYPLFPLGNNFRGPAGGLLIGIKDLSKIIEVFLNNGLVNGVRLLQPATLDLMLTRHWVGKTPEYYAKGLQLRFFPYKNHLFKGHTGSAYGLISFLFFNEAEQIGICFAANGGHYQESQLGMTDVLEKVFAAFYENFLEKN